MTGEKLRVSGFRPDDPVWRGCCGQVESERALGKRVVGPVGILPVK